MCEGQVSYSSELSLWVCNIFQISKPPYLKGNLIIIFGPTSALLLLLSSGMTKRLITRFIRLNIIVIVKYSVSSPIFNQSINLWYNNRWYKIINLTRRNEFDATMETIQTKNNKMQISSSG